MVAFGGEKQVKSAKFVEIGREIVDKCGGVPLAIRVVGTLLFGQDEDKWQALEKKGLASISKDKNDISAILKLSYYHLDSSLKSCFTYCALFPKDFKIEKRELICLWMAQGYVKSNEEQSIEDVCEEYFMILLRRCFFQDVAKDEYDEVTCKIHDLMHDMAQEIAGKEIRIATSTLKNLDKRVRHVFDDVHNCAESFHNQTKIRTFYLERHWNSALIPVDASLLTKLMYIRVLNLRFMKIESLPEAIGKLVHLRYLDLSGNNTLEVLPVTITKLHNLQSLDLSWCAILRELPKDLCKLVKLRLLDITYCDKLTHMPRGMENLTSLTWLSDFIVGERNPDVGDLEAVRPLSNLKGRLSIEISKGYTYVKQKEEKGGVGGYLSNKPHLIHVEVDFGETSSSVDEGRVDRDQWLLEDLQPHSHLRGLRLYWYQGLRMPRRWARADNLGTFLPKLVKIEFYRCFKLEELPWLGKLPCLKYIQLEQLYNLEYMENDNSSSSSYRVGSSPGVFGSTDSGSASVFFPSLEELKLEDLRKLRGWWRTGCGLSAGQHHSHSRQLPSFPQLSTLSIWSCPNLTSIPLCHPRRHPPSHRHYRCRSQILQVQEVILN